MDDEYQTAVAIKAYKAHQYDVALHAALSLSKHNIQVGHYLCGLIYELGLSSKGQNFLFAYKYFEILANGFDDDEGFLGCARIILKERDGSKIELGLSYCIKAISLTDNQFAYLILGRIYEDMLQPHDLTASAKAYFQAATKGAAWGWRRLAFLEFKKKRYLRSVLLHVLATLLFPLYLLFGGSRALREG